MHVYGENATRKAAVYRWVTRFSEGRESVVDEERVGRPAISSTEENFTKVRQILCETRRLTVRRIAEEVSIDRETVRKILTEDLHMRKLCAKKGPKGSQRRTKAKKSQNFLRPFGQAR